MSYFRALTPIQIQKRRDAFHKILIVDSNDSHKVTFNANQTDETMNLVADYIGWRIYRTYRIKKRWQEKRVDIFDYLEHYRETDGMLTNYIMAGWLEKTEQINRLAYRLMNRFMDKFDELLEEK